MNDYTRKTLIKKIKEQLQKLPELYSLVSNKDINRMVISLAHQGFSGTKLLSMTKEDSNPSIIKLLTSTAQYKQHYNSAIVELVQLFDALPVIEDVSTAEEVIASFNKLGSKTIPNYKPIPLADSSLLLLAIKVDEVLLSLAKL